MDPDAIEENFDRKKKLINSTKINYNNDLTVRQGGSPDQDFFRQVLVGGVLCSSYTLGNDGHREGKIGDPTELSILRAT